MSINYDDELMAVAALLENNESNEEDQELLAIAALLEQDDDDNSKPMEIESLHQKNVTGSTKPLKPRLCEDNGFANACNGKASTTGTDVNMTPNIVKEAEEFDSSDEEGRSSFLERKYNEYGKNIKQKLNERKQQAQESRVANEVTALLKNKEVCKVKSSPLDVIFKTNDEVVRIKNPHCEIKRTSLLSRSFQQQVTSAASTIHTPTMPNASPIYCDPIFGLRIINPLVSSEMLKERMKGRLPVPFSGIAYHVERGDLSKDWVIAGAVVTKHPLRTTKKGDAYSMWQLSDLHGDIKMITLFLFRNAHKDLWKTPEGTCIAVLNPSVFEKRAGSNDVACLTIDSSNKVMILGTSKDLGRCRAMKRNGEKCTVVVNVTECDYCVYHVKQEYSKMSRRSELQSATAGRGLNELRNKVLGKSEVFYGGQSFSAIPARKSVKLIAKDKERLSSLSEYAVSPFASTINHPSKEKTAVAAIPYAGRTGPISKMSENLDVSSKQRQKDLERLKLLQCTNQNVANSTKNPAMTVAADAILTEKFPVKITNSQLSVSPSVRPKLSSDNFSIEVDINLQKAAAARQKAAQLLKNQPVAKMDPNGTRGTKDGKRRVIDMMNDEFHNDSAKRQRLQEAERELERKSRIERIMAAASSHSNLIDERQREQRDEYFNKLEKKEALEEKMLSTFKIDCKAVVCRICKYTAFSASDSCKEKRHPLKVIDAEKRFFQCKDCQNRTVTLLRLPNTNCKNCQGSRWMRAAMIRERKVETGADALSIRGHEETFLGNFSATSGNLNLLVPED